MTNIFIYYPGVVTEMKGLTKVEGVSPEEIVDFLEEESIPYELMPWTVTLNHRDGYSDDNSNWAISKRIQLHPDHRKGLEEKFPRGEWNQHYDFQAKFRPNSADFLENHTGLMEIVDGLLIVKTKMDYGTLCPK
tara:strand:- start:411 stop:812 length:402 start_codon:yes stop_codon:yes gene_type:complete